MKSMFALIILAALIVCSPAFAGDNASGFGLGLMLGEPSGLSAKVWMGERTAVAGGLALSARNDAGLAAHVDYLWFAHNMDKMDSGILPFYYGVGVRYRDRDGRDDNFGIRIPLGLNYMFARSAFDVFFEAVPILDVAPEQEFAFSVAVGGRYFF